jgi:hypothetical protein
MAKNLTFAFVLLLAALSAAYGQSSVPTDTAIKMHRFTEAFGVLPEYDLTIKSDGTVIFKQLPFPVISGPHPSITGEPIESKISVATVATLVAEFERVKFFSLHDRYSKTEGGCPVYYYDAISTEISITVNGKSKTVFHDYGCVDKDRNTYPADLQGLATKIDTLVNTKQWIKQ